MASFSTLLVVYVLGGLTFVPLVIASVFLFAYLTWPEALLHPPEPPLRRDEDGEDVFRTEDEKLVRRLANSEDVAAGYFLVTRSWVPGGVNGKPPERASPVGTAPLPAPSSPSVYQSMYRSLFDRKSNIGAQDAANAQKARGKRAMNEFFVVLRHGHLMLYDDEHQAEVRHVVSLGLYSVSIYGGGQEIPEGELYIRRNAICLTRIPSTIDRSLGVEALPFYMFSENCSNKEDFYLALVKHQEKDPLDPAVPPRPLRYRQKDVVALVQRLHSSEDQLQMNWVNGLLGRVFLSVYRTPEVEEFIRAKIVKKISRVTKPNFLSDIKVGAIYVGDSVPCITNPRLKEMTTDGDFCCEFDITYSGNFRLEIATKATMNLGARFKPREVNLLLAVLLKRLDGHCVIRIKPPPSNRLWFSFERMPKMELVIEPIVGSRQVAWGPILRIIESRIREVIEESVVLPYYDDIPFTDTIDQQFRGGIWHSVHRKPPHRASTTPEKGKEEEEKEKEQGETSAEDSAVMDGEIDEQPFTSDPPRKTHSAPTLVVAPSTAPSVEKAASIAGTTADENDIPLARTPSTQSSERRKSARAPSFHSISPSPPAPSVGTDAVNVTAVTRDPTDVASSAISAIKTRNSPQQPSPMSTRLKQSDENATQHEDTFGTYVSGGSAQAFGNNFISRSGTTGTSASTTSSSSLDSISAIGTATAAVKKWYATRKNAAESNLNHNTPNPPLTPTAAAAPPAHPHIPEPPSATHHSQHSHNHSSSTSNINIIPPPQLHKKASTPPINVPASKRRPLPPPLLPSRKRAPPPLPPRGEGQVMVVAAPESEPSTPDGFDPVEGMSFEDEGVEGEGVWRIAEDGDGKW